MVEDTSPLFVQFLRGLVHLNWGRHVWLARTILPHVLCLFVEAGVNSVVLPQGTADARECSTFYFCVRSQRYGQQLGNCAVACTTPRRRPSTPNNSKKLPLPSAPPPPLCRDATVLPRPATSF